MGSSVKRIRTALVGTLLFAGVFALLLFANPFNNHKNPIISELLSNNNGVSETLPQPPKTITGIQTGGISLAARTKQSYFYLLQNGEWNCTYLKGVNMGLTLPNTDLDNPAISYDTYMLWLEAIAGMNANTVRVFSIMHPDFYRAFDDYNKKTPNRPLYLLQGVWFNETWMESVGDAFGEQEKILKGFTRAVCEAVDIIHGKSDYTSYGQLEKAVYDRDISRYVAGFILGLEWPPDFVKTTNDEQAGMQQYTGRFLTTDNAQPFEIFLARVGDTLIGYETEKYSFQAPVSFLNWSTTDTIIHTNQPFPEDDMVSVDTETIKPTAAYHAGLFAAVDVYPYYPEFMNHQPQYLGFKDARGSNPYRAYLRDLRKEYSVPVIIAEYGVPTSRGIAHKSAMGYDQGGITETRQGEIVAAMSQDIALEGYAGGLIFSWQDEWFKQTWNTVKYAPGDPIRRGLNVESAEQRYGIAAYDPGDPQSAGYPDGELREWTGDAPVYSEDGVSLYAKTDEAYLYLLLRLPTEWDAKPYGTPISLTGHGSFTAAEYRLKFCRPVDFLLILDGRENTRLLTDAYYDRYYFQYSVEKRIFDRNPVYEQQDTGIFNSICNFISNEMIFPLDGKIIQPQHYESGLLRFGNANPSAPSFDSLADFYALNNTVELRIPWYLLNVLSGTEKVILDDFYKAQGVSITQAQDLYFAATSLDSRQTITLRPYKWKEIRKSAYHMRLKKSYGILKEAFAALMPDYT